MSTDDGRIFAYAMGAIRSGIPLNCWDGYADLIAADRRRREHALRKSEPDRSWFDLLKPLHRDGFVKLPTTLSKFVVDDIVSYLTAYPVHKGPHVYSFDSPSQPYEEVRSNYSMAAYRSIQCMSAPHVVDCFNDPRLIDLLEEHLGCVPTLYSLTAWWSFPAKEPELVYSQFFHRDIDDWRFVTLFLYLTDVDGSSGPHQVIPKSHRVEGMAELLAKAKATGKSTADLNPAESFVSTMGEEYSRKWEAVLGDSIFDVVGPAGTMHLVNTMALHRGLTPSRSPRLIMWARYGLGSCVNSSDLEQGPLAKRLVPTHLSDTPRNRYVNRLLFDFDRGPQSY